MGRFRDLLAGPSREEMAAIESLDLRRAAVAQTEGLFDIAIPSWYQDNLGVSSTLGALGTGFGNARLAERVWVANRCQQMNAQQIASMPIEFHGPDGAEPAWVSQPDPNWYPNGIADALHSIVEQIYGWGFVLLYVTDFYATGYPRTWTVLDSSQCEVKIRDGVRVFVLGDTELNPDRVVQIDRNPGSRLHGTSALRAYGQLALGALTAEEQAMSVNAGGVPQFYLKAKRPVNEQQAAALQAKWVQRTSQRGGAPPVLPPDIDAQQLSINPADLALLDNREYNARAICTAYGVPSVLLNMALQGGLTYQNPGALGEMWWRFELRPMSTRLADAFSARMLPRGQWVSFRAEDTFAPLTEQSPANDEQAALEQPQVIGQTPPLKAVTG